MQNSSTRPVHTQAMTLNFQFLKYSKIDLNHLFKLFEFFEKNKKLSF